MTTKEKLLKLFESNKGRYFSGEEIAQVLGLSRAAVWKAVKSLRNEGYSIDAVTNRGYCLSESTDILSPQGIEKYLRPEYQLLQLTVMQSADSTNTMLREKANAGAAQGCVVIANQQTGGKGRSGRSFYSPADTGAYLSILLRPEACNAAQALRITTTAAVAMCEAIEEVSEEKTEIKWVNDIFMHGKKVCGILTEGSFSMETGLLDYAVLGAGINLYSPAGGFPEELKEIAGAVFPEKGDDLKNRLVAAFLNRFFDCYAKENPVSLIEKYRSRCFVIGRQVEVVQAGGSRNAIATGIDDACRLLVTYENGETAALSYGEIRIKV